jgi:hypothetical protein
MREQGMLAVAGLHPAFIAQPQSMAQMAYQNQAALLPNLRVQTSLTVPQEEFNISSSVSDPGHMSPYSPTSPAFQTVSAYYTRSEQASPNFLVPTAQNPTYPETYSDVTVSPHSPAQSEEETAEPMVIELADAIPDRRMSCELLPPIPPFIPKRNPGYTLAKSFIPIVASMIPKEQEIPIKLDAIDPEYWENCEWGLMQEEYLQLNGPQTPLTATTKWLRKLHIPQRMRRRQLAGQWDFKDGETEKSLKSAPSVIALN